MTYDDGSLQAWADEEYGTNVVIVVPGLVDGRDAQALSAGSRVRLIELMQ